jgi:hypothetical protein
MRMRTLQQKTKKKKTEDSQDVSKEEIDERRLSRFSTSERAYFRKRNTAPHRAQKRNSKESSLTFDRSRLREHRRYYRQETTNTQKRVKKVNTKKGFAPGTKLIAYY